ncbi:MAG: polymer-forming cytoskeletal protein [Alphaproteobacteria bacterium]|nr:MAG: polymer-forming cytoskeletal protein [Alphaproteobacteria bacterium]
MFSNNRKSDTASAPKPARNTNIPSIISESLKIEGDLYSEGEIQIDGEVNGNISAGTLSAGAAAVITGDIEAKEMTIRGTVTGALKGEEIILTASAVIKGDILHASLSIEPGAKIDGHLKHSENPRGQKDTVTFLEKSETAASGEK